jgi:hypothetical protein
MVAQITILNDSHSPAHKLVKASTATRVYAVTFAEPFPSQAEAEALWRDDRRAFRPYNESTGRYIK